jgi:hypothetical protein
MLLRPSGGGTGSRVSEIERRREKAERESPYAERHVEPVVAAESEAWKCGTRFRLCTLTCRARRYFFARVLLLSATPTVQRNHFFFADCRFAHWTDLAVRSCFQPLVKARPAEQMTAHTDDCIPRCVKANVALEHTIIFLLFFGRPRTVAVGVFCRMLRSLCSV